MPNQNVRCLTGNEIRAGDNRAQEAASRDFYMKQLEIMQDRFDQIVKAAVAGETVTVFDQWGDSVVLSKHQP